MGNYQYVILTKSSHLKKVMFDTHTLLIFCGGNLRWTKKHLTLSKILTQSIVSLGWLNSVWICFKWNTSIFKVTKKKRWYKYIIKFDP